jgi:hypothetical protein
VTEEVAAVVLRDQARHVDEWADDIEGGKQDPFSDSTDFEHAQQRSQSDIGSDVNAITPPGVPAANT